MLHQALSPELMYLLQKVGHIVIKRVKFEHNKHFWQSFKSSLLDLFLKMKLKWEKSLMQPVKLNSNVL